MTMLERDQETNILIHALQKNVELIHRQSGAGSYRSAGGLGQR